MSVHECLRMLDGLVSTQYLLFHYFLQVPAAAGFEPSILESCVNSFTTVPTVAGLVPIDIGSLQNRLLKVCYVPATSASLPRLLFLLRPLTVLMKQTRQVVCDIKQSILLRCLCLYHRHKMNKTVDA
jgi:hypothetical protein